MWVSLLALLGLALLVGCGSVQEEEKGPRRVVLPWPTPVSPVPPGFGRYVGAEDRLVFPTATPVSTATPRPVREKADIVKLLREAAGTPEPSPVAGPVSGPAPDYGDVPDGELSCLGHYRRMLVDYNGMAPFGADVAVRLSGEFEEARPDCAGEGWLPEFGLERTCTSTWIGGIFLSRSFLRPEGNMNVPTTRGTGRDEEGNIFLHFRRLPLRGEPGCWYYSASREVWAWSVPGVAEGIDWPVFPVCDARLRSVLLEARGAGFGPVDVARGIDRVRLELPRECPSARWSPYPRREAHEDCSVAVETGRWRNAMVVNWHPDHPASGGAVCWVMIDGEWSESYPVEEGG